METKKRACIAIIAASVSNKRNYSYVYDYLESRYNPIQVNYSNNGYISAFDYSRGGYVSGTIPSLFDYVSSSYISLNVEHDQITVFDYQTSSYCFIRVSGVNVSVYDYKEGRWFYYTIS